MKIEQPVRGKGLPYWSNLHEALAEFYTQHAYDQNKEARTNAVREFLKTAPGLWLVEAVHGEVPAPVPPPGPSNPSEGVEARKWPDEALYLGKEISPFTGLLSEFQTAHDKAAGGDCGCKLCKRYGRLKWDLFLPPSKNPAIRAMEAARRARDLGLAALPPKGGAPASGSKRFSSVEDLVRDIYRDEPAEAERLIAGMAECASREPSAQGREAMLKAMGDVYGTHLVRLAQHQKASRQLARDMAGALMQAASDHLAPPPTEAPAQGAPAEGVGLEAVRKIWLEWRENGMANAVTKAGEYLYRIGKVVEPDYPADRLRAAALPKVEGCGNLARLENEIIAAACLWHNVKGNGDDGPEEALHAAVRAYMEAPEEGGDPVSKTRPEPGAREAEEIVRKLDTLYNAEINIRISSFFDAGYTVEVGDELNGTKAADQCLYGLKAAVDSLWRMALNLHPSLADHSEAATPSAERSEAAPQPPTFAHQDAFDLARYPFAVGGGHSNYSEPPTGGQEERAAPGRGFHCGIHRISGSSGTCPECAAEPPVQGDAQ